MRIERIKIAFVLICAFFSLLSLQQSAAQTKKNQPRPAPTPKPPINYERFTHQSHLGQVNIPNTNQNRELKCNSCHERVDVTTGIVSTTDRNKRLSLKFPGHKACVDCHVVQFTGKPQLTCTNCHDTKGGLTARPPQRDFAKRYDFNALFDGKQHELHIKYLFTDGKKLDCNYCHLQTAKPSYLTIPTHPECYTCHSPTSGDQKAKLKSDCAACHTTRAMDATPFPPFSDKYASRAYGATFTHKAHVDYEKNDSYACHSISGGYNRPLQTPTSIRIKEHFNNPNERSGRGCFSCHDGGQHYGRRVFSGEPGETGGGS